MCYGFALSPPLPPPPPPPPAIARHWGLGVLSEVGRDHSTLNRKLPYLMGLQTLSRVAYQSGAQLEQSMRAFLCGCEPWGDAQSVCAACTPSTNQVEWGLYQSTTITTQYFMESHVWVLVVHDRSANAIILAFRGTQWNANAFVDLATTPTYDSTLGLMLHEGFREAYYALLNHGTFTGYW